jgi:Fic family protein
VTDLPDNWREWASEEVHILASAWLKHKILIAGSPELEKFNARLRRQWAIETGAIEGLYKIDRGITLLLMERGIHASLVPHGSVDKPVESVMPLIQDQESALEGLFDFVAGNRPLTPYYIKELHQLLTRSQPDVVCVNGMGRTVNMPLVSGDWKKLPNNPLRPDGGLHFYCPPEHTPMEMDRLVAMHLNHVGAKVPPEIEAAWLHHRFTQIHPFQDGNGRVARALASLVFLRAGWFPLVVVSDTHRNAYIAALEEADQGDLSRLVRLFARLEKTAFIQALSLAGEVEIEQESYTALLKAVKSRLSGRLPQENDEALHHHKALETARDLGRIILEKLEAWAEKLQAVFDELPEKASAKAEVGTDIQSYWYYSQIVQVARQLDYFANTRRYHAWTRLQIRERRKTSLVFSVHCVGVTFTGIMAVSAFMEHRDLFADFGASVEGPIPLCSEVFTFTFAEAPAKVLARFEPWFKEAVTNGISRWQREL